MTRTMHGNGRTASRLLGVALLACVLVLLSTAASAAAMPGPSTLSTGFVEDPLLLEYPPPNSVPPVWSTRMAQLGSSWTRIGVDWNDIAPSPEPPGFQPADPGDPHYNWWYLDNAVREATAAGQHILLTFSYPPGWALGKNPGPSGRKFPGTWKPSPSAFGAFAHAVAERYSGTYPDPANAGSVLPRVSYFQAWNEENLPGFLEPQWTRTRAGWQASGPAVYRSLLNAMYASVKAVQPGAYVIVGGLAPYGDPPGDGRMRPVVFLQGLLCLSSQNRPLPCPNPAHFDALDIHPYGLTPTTHAINPLDISTPDVGRLIPILNAAERSGRALPRGSKPIWATELDWDSSPPDRSGVSLARQAQFVSLSFYELWSQGIGHVMWFEVRDMAQAGNALTGYGLFFRNQQPKPSTLAFRFPFVAVPASRGLITLWGRAPSAGAVTVDQLRHGRWQPLTRVGTTRGGVFYVQRRLAAGVVLRARAGSVTSYPYTS